MYKSNLHILTSPVMVFLSQVHKVHDQVVQSLIRVNPGFPGGGVLPSKRLLGVCRWMGSHFHNWTDYNGVTFLVELLEWGRKFIFQDFWDTKILVSRDFNRKIRGEKMVPTVVLIFNSWLALNSILEITMTFAQK